MLKEFPIHDFTKYCEACLKITTKDNKLVPFKLNSFQKRLVHQMQKLEKEKKPVRIIVLKARQVGFSTLIAAWTYFKASTNFYTRCATIAHDADSTDNLFEKSRRFYDFFNPTLRPMRRYSNKKEMIFENPNEKSRGDEPGLLSAISVDTANNAAAGRSDTIHHLHISELAFWRESSNPIIGLIQSVPKKPNTSIIIESTANGFDGDGGEFYRRVQSALKKDDTGFEFFFVPWFECEDYSMEPPHQFSLSEKELELMQRFNLKLPQLYWRRYMISQEFDGDEVKFRQEYPSTPEEAFILSGNPVFNSDKLIQDINSCDFTYETEDYLRIFKLPEPGKAYVIGADIAEGLESGDSSTAFVMDKEFNQVARVCGKFEPDIFGSMLASIAKRYNNALVAPEVNNMGYATVAKLKNIGYTNVYMREDFSEVADKISSRLGWHTNAKTKMLMLNEFNAAWRDNIIKIKDVELLREMLLVTREPNGDVVLNGKDLTVSACIAVQAVKQLPSTIYTPVFPEQEKASRPGLSFQDRMKLVAKKRTQGYYHG